MIAEGVVRSLGSTDDGGVDDVLVDEAVADFCPICLEEFEWLRGRLQINAAGLKCGHAFHGACIAAFLSSRVAENRLAIGCPYDDDGPCGEPLDVRRLLAAHGSGADVARYDRFAGLAADPGARDCPECGALAGGDGRGRAICGRCGLDFCALHHQTHSAAICAAAEERVLRAHARAERKSARVVRRTSKPCPGCGVPTDKLAGCNHMKCRCGADWCWLCGSAFEVGAADVAHFARAGPCPNAATVTPERALDCAARVLGRITAALPLAALVLTCGVCWFSALASVAGLARLARRLRVPPVEAARADGALRALGVAGVLTYLAFRIVGVLRASPLDFVFAGAAFCAIPCLAVQTAGPRETLTCACVPFYLLFVACDLPNCLDPLRVLAALTRVCCDGDGDDGDDAGAVRGSPPAPDAADRV